MSLIFTPLKTNSNKIIFCKDYKSFKEAYDQLNLFELGEITETMFLGAIKVGEQNPRDNKNDKFYESENEDGFYQYIIENHEDFYRLIVKFTNKHKMITAAMTGDLEMFVENFSNYDIMKKFSMNKALFNGHWNIINYLIENYEIKNNVLWDAIRFNKVEVVLKLIDKGYILPYDWLACCLYNNSYDVAKALLANKKTHHNCSKEELETSWFKREILKSSKTVELVRELLKS